MAIDRGNDDFLLATFICLKNRPLAIAEVYDIDVARHTTRVARFFGSLFFAALLLSFSTRRFFVPR